MRDITVCHPKLQYLADRLVEECTRRGFKIKITETMRTVAEQDALYAQGRTSPGKIVTNTKGSTYSSMHQWGIAFDFCRNDGKGAYNEAGGFFDQVGKIGQVVGLEWGGSWKSIVDKPHMQLPDWGSGTGTLKGSYKTPDAFMKTWKFDNVIGWVKDANGWWYRRSDGSYPANKWCVINHHWYLFNSDGYLCTSWHRWDGKTVDPVDGSGDWYYFDPTQDGQLEGACWRSLDNGAMMVWYVDLSDNI